MKPQIVEALRDAPDGDPWPPRGLSQAEIDLMNRLFVPPPLPEGHPRNRHERRQAAAYARARKSR